MKAHTDGVARVSHIRRRIESLMCSARVTPIRVVCLLSRNYISYQYDRQTIISLCHHIMNLLSLREVSLPSSRNLVSPRSRTTDRVDDDGDKSF